MNAMPRAADSQAVLCGLAGLYPLFVAKNDLGVPGGYSTLVVAWTIADAVALVILQVRHSWPSRGFVRPRGWPATLLLQAVLTYALVPATGWHPMIMCGFLAGSALLLIPATPGRITFAAVIASIPVLWAVKPPRTVTTLEATLGGMNDPVFQTAQGLGETWQPQQLVDIALRLGPPVHGWLYSNTNYILLGMIIQKVTGQSPVTEIRHRILAPLGLRDTSFPLTSTQIPSPYAHGYYGSLDVTNVVNDCCHPRRSASCWPPSPLMTAASCSPSTTGWVSTAFSCPAGPRGGMTAGGPAASRPSPIPARAARARPSWSMTTSR